MTDSSVLPPTTRPVEPSAGEMVKRVAREIAAANGHDPDALATGPKLHPYTPTPIWYAFRDSARAAIWAMREPTGEMTTAGKHFVKGCESTYERDIAEGAYTVMIDAALSAKGSAGEASTL